MTYFRDFSRFFALFPVLFLMLLGADAGKAPQDDLSKLQGSWTMVSASRMGKPMPDGDTVTLEFAGNVMFLKSQKRGPEKGQFTLNPVAKPKSIDMIPINPRATEPKANEPPVLFIYELSGDDLKLCWVKPGGQRPVEFVSQPDNSIMVLKRQPAATQPANP